MIRPALENDQLACGVFIDKQKTFDTVDRKVLLSKIKFIPLWNKSYSL